MPSILSQREIDALLSALPVEETAPGASSDLAKVGKPVKAYDFRHPEKFSRDQLRTLEFLHENFARRLQTALSAYLRTVVTASSIAAAYGLILGWNSLSGSFEVLPPVTSWSRVDSASSSGT